MLATSPYIFVSQRMRARIDVEPSHPQGGVVTQTVEGHHAIWTATIPYIPALAQETARLFGSDENSRIRWLLDRQTHFLYDLAQITNHQATFEFRFVADPRPGAEARVSLVLFGKTFAPDPANAEMVAQLQWERVRTLFPSEPPYHYPLAPVTAPDDPPNTPPWEAQSFAHWFDPIPNAELDAGRSGILELRKYEDWPRLPFMGNAHLDVDYIPHPFNPPLEYAGLARLLQELARQRSPAFIGVTLRPQRATAGEEVQFSRFADWYEKAAHGDLINMNPVIVEQRKQGRHDYDAYFRIRAELGKKVYEALARERQSLFLAGIRIVAKIDALPALKEAAGSELIANSGDGYPCQYAVYAPQSADEKEWARFNMRWLELERWGISPQLLPRAPLPAGVPQPTDYRRFRFFVTVSEALAAFRLPTAAPDTQLHGMVVRDEPFAAIPTDTPRKDDLVGLGQVMAAGTATPIEYRLPRQAVAGGVCVIGDDGATRATVARMLVAYLAQSGAPVAVLGPDESETMRAAISAAPGQQGVAKAWESALRLIAPSPGMTMSVWADAIARGLALATDLPTRSSQTLRGGVVRAIKSAGLDPGTAWRAGQRVPTLAELADGLEAEASHDSGDPDLTRAMRERCAPILRELAALQRSSGSPAPTSSPQENPTFAQIPPTGVADTQRLLAALVCAAELATLSHTARVADEGTLPSAALILIEPQELLSHQRAGDQPLLAPLETFRRSGGALLTFTARPHLLDSEMLAASTFAAYHLASADAIAACQHLLRLTERETRRFAALAADEGLWKRDGAAVLVRRTPTYIAIRAPGNGGDA